MTVSNYASSSPASATSFDLAFPSSTVAGSTLLAGIRTGSALTVTAALVSGSSLTALGPFDNGAGRQYLFYLQNGPGGAQTVRFTMSASGAPRLCVAEITDATATSFDVSTNNSGTGTALTGGATATTAQAAEEAIGLFSIAANETFTQNGSYAVVGVEPAAGSSRLALVHQTLSATGTPNAAVDANASAAWIGQTATFRVSGGAAAASLIYKPEPLAALIGR